MSYDHPLYAASLAEFGQPTPLPRCGGQLLVREIPGTELRDAMGPYPIFSCREWTALSADLDELAGRLVSVTVVPDPFAPVELEALRRTFDHCRPFKSHFVVDLDRTDDTIRDRHHRRSWRRARRAMEVVVAERPHEHTETWCRLYAVLAARHELRGIQAFSPGAFARQLEIPGTVLLLALGRDRVLGAQIWYRRGAVAYNHLVAVDPEGYELRASFALYGEAIRIFRRDYPEIRCLDLGGASGSAPDSSDGLARFKRGWATTTRPVYLCGRVLDAARYAVLSARAPSAGPVTSYFPAYRAGELTRRAIAMEAGALAPARD